MNWNLPSLSRCFGNRGTPKYVLQVVSDSVGPLSHTRLEARDRCILRSLVGLKAETVQIHFTCDRCILALRVLGGRKN